jgi:hypothetical protein
MFGTLLKKKLDELINIVNNRPNNSGLFPKPVKKVGGKVEKQVRLFSKKKKKCV